MKTKQQNSFSMKTRFKSFVYAYKGILVFFKEEHNARIHLFLAVLASCAGFYFKIDASEWMALIFAIGFVLACEAFNSAIENLCDVISPEQHSKIGKIKDIAAGAVLMSAIAALLVGILIFLPKFLAMCC